jgi:uncharacterized protein (TIGR02421 family)
MILGLQETITITGAGQSFDEPCFIAPDQDESSFTADLIRELSQADAVEPGGESGEWYRVKFTIAGIKKQTLVREIAALPGGVRVCLGRRDIGDFLIDPQRRPAPLAVSAVRSDLRAVDRQLAQIDRDLLLLKYLKPTNLAAERERLAADRRYSPLFTYRVIEGDMAEIRRRLKDPVRDDSALGQLLEKKRRELRRRLDLLEARGDASRFTRASIALFGRPTAALQRAAKTALRNRPDTASGGPAERPLTAKDAAEKFEAVLRQYGLHDWQVSIRPALVADCTVGGGHIYLREDATFEPSRIEALVKHEIETHILTAENGDHQPYELFRRGTAGYLDTQEGLATYNQQRVYGPEHERRYNPSRNLLGLAFGLEHSFVETRQYLEAELGYSPEKALTQAINIKRGLTDTSEPGGFTKSAVYFRGLRAIEEFVAAGGNLADLYIGKITLADLDLIKQVPDLQSPVLLPAFLREGSSA